MTSTLVALCFDSNDPVALARFWAGLLGWRSTADRDRGSVVLPDDETGFRLRFVPARTEKAGPNRIHLDLTSTSSEQQQETVARALGLGARHIDVGQLPEEPHVVLADPEGNELCVIEPGNRFLADCGLIGAINCDGTQEVGHFWSEALAWPLVWDQDGETAIQSPSGGTKIAWGGPPVAPKTGTNRLRFELGVRGEPQAEVERLISLGATPIDHGRSEVGSVSLADPDDNEFIVTGPIACGEVRGEG